MAKKVSVQLIDDLTGDPIAPGEGGSVQFGWAGIDYTIDLSDLNALLLKEKLQPYIDTAKKVTGTRRRRSATGGGSGRSKKQIQAIREWAKNHGYEVSDRGRISDVVQEAFDQSH